ncbi:MAG: hypothetical protein HC888_07980 [Candidatus Competibacteraceae bacterium]|nr:hypothetical protein [Candidatus Competibacteraceae bacterium]
MLRAELQPRNPEDPAKRVQNHPAAHSPDGRRCRGRGGYRRAAAYANGIGPDKNLVVKQPEIVQWAHARKLLVHPYTVRRDLKPPKYATTQDELKALYFEYDVDGLFSDFPDDAVAVLKQGR